jgi:chromosome segregation ATPase
MCRAVNKKALDQHINFSEQRDELVRRRDESHVAEAKIQQLITTLDMRKDEAIERTFKVRLPVSQQRTVGRRSYVSAATVVSTPNLLLAPTLVEGHQAKVSFTKRRLSALARLQGVAKNFKEIFEALAPGGAGQLVMLKRGLPAAEPDADDGEDGERPPPSASERYKGVRVKVRAPCRRRLICLQQPGC